MNPNWILDFDQKQRKRSPPLFPSLVSSRPVACRRPKQCVPPCNARVRASAGTVRDRPPLARVEDCRRRVTIFRHNSTRATTQRPMRRDATDASSASTRVDDAPRTTAYDLARRRETASGTCGRGRRAALERALTAATRRAALDARGNTGDADGGAGLKASRDVGRDAGMATEDDERDVVAWARAHEAMDVDEEFDENASAANNANVAGSGEGTRRRLERWADESVFRNVSGKYVEFDPTPRSTIAVAYSPDGRTLASTHGDHTVKLIDTATGDVMTSLVGHDRTPWVVCFHPTNPDVLASGSLDNTVIVWDRKTGAMTARWDFGKSIASLAFLPGSDLLLVTAGHKLSSWNYRRFRHASQMNPDGNLIRREDATQVLLRTRRSLRVVHFHPTGMPFLMTAEVCDMDTTSMSVSLTRDTGDNALLGTSNYDQEGGVYVASRDAPGSSAGTRHGISEALADALHDIGTIQPHGYGSTPQDSLVTPVHARRIISQPRERLRASLGVMDRPVPVAGRQNPPMSLAQVAGRAAQAEPPAENVEAPQMQPPTDQDPCVVKLKLWEYETYTDENGDVNIKPLTELRLVLPHTVLCSEMGAHFSPCGRFIATTQACKPPVRVLFNNIMDVSARRYVCELRVYSIDGRNFGEVLCARAVKAAHCLTSIQFSPSSAHVLLAYGRRHQSLSLLMADGDTFTQVNTVIEIFDAKNMHLLRIIPSVEDEVNVACFHPRPGGGVAYGTKEGKLRLLVHADAHRSDARIASNADFTSMHQN